MNKNELKTFGAVSLIALAVGVTVKDHIKVTRMERETRRKINLDAQEEITAIRVAAARVDERLNNGYYRGKSISTVMNDLEFETIIERNREK